MNHYKKLTFFIVTFPKFLLCTQHNIFIIKDTQGNIIKDKQLTHAKNAYFNEEESLKEMDKILNKLDKLSEEKREKKFKQEQNELLNHISNLKQKRENENRDVFKYNKENILKNAKKHLGEDYVWGGTTPGSFDCSGYTQYIYKKEGVSIPRTAYQQSKVGQKVSRFELKKGDLLFFLTDRSRGIPVTHVGIYLGNDTFIHAASKKKGIIISSFSKSRYSKLFVTARRIIE